LQNINKQYFKYKLLSWHKNTNRREMPWKGEKDPYRIWLSEIILQQTRVAQGTKYYNKFICKYKTITELANASDDQVFKDWEGLGYYNRCRNMLYTARYLRDTHRGKFPTTYDEIISLKGIGEYTAAAIASFAYNLPYAVVDGNVVRVFSRWFGIDRAMVSAQDKKFYQSIADAYLAKRSARKYNQAIMDFGATVCTPMSPDCEACPFKRKCVAFQTNSVENFPPKKKKVALKKRSFHYILLHDGECVYLRKRIDKGIWQSLYEPILVESESKPKWLGLKKADSLKSQKLSHQSLKIHFYILKKMPKPILDLSDYEKISLKKLDKKAFPRSIYEFLKEFEYI